MALSDLWFWTGAKNSTGLINIRGDELAALISEAAGGPSAQVGKGCAVQRAPADTVPDGFPGLTITWTGFPNPFYDDLGFFSGAAPTLLTIPDVDPPIERVLCMGQLVWSGNATSHFEGHINHNGGQGFIGGSQSMISGNDSITQYLNCISGPTDVVAGDTFELIARQFTTPAAAQTLARAQMSLVVTK